MKNVFLSHSNNTFSIFHQAFTLEKPHNHNKNECEKYMLYICETVDMKRFMASRPD